MDPILAAFLISCIFFFIALTKIEKVSDRIDKLEDVLRDNWLTEPKDSHELHEELEQMELSNPHTLTPDEAPPIRELYYYVFIEMLHKVEEAEEYIEENANLKEEVAQLQKRLKYLEELAGIE